MKGGALSLNDEMSGRHYADGNGRRRQYSVLLNKLQKGPHMRACILINQAADCSLFSMDSNLFADERDARLGLDRVSPESSREPRPLDELLQSLLKGGAAEWLGRRSAALLRFAFFSYRFTYFQHRISNQLPSEYIIYSGRPNTGPPSVGAH